MRIYTTLACLFFTATVLQAQITLTYDDYAQMGAAAASTMYTAEQTSDFQLDIGGTGAGQTWDFTGFTYSQETMSNTFVDPATTPYAAQFPGATHATFTQTSEGAGYAYMKLDHTGFYFMGIVGMAQGQQFVLAYDPAKPEMKFPGTLNTSWTYNGNPIDIGGIMTQQTRSENVIDAAGTIVLPQGSYECLRLRSTEWQTSKVEYNGQVVSEDVTKSISYSFMTKNGVNASVFADTNSAETGTITASDLSYTIFSGTSPVAELAFSDDFALQAAYPNPLVSGAQTTVGWKLPVQTNVAVSVYDARGREVAQVYEGRLNAGVHTHTVSTAGFAPGMYMVRLTAGGRVFTSPLAVIR